MEPKQNPPLKGFAEAALPAGAPQWARWSATSRGLGLLTLIGLLGVVAACGAGLTQPSDRAWTGLVLAALALWGAWMFWRMSLRDPGVPASVLHPFIGVVLVILLAHLFGEGDAAPVEGRIDLMGRPNPGVFIRLMTLGFLVLLVQDMLPRLRDSRWALTVVGLLIGSGAVARLQVAGETPHGIEAVALTGLAGVGVFLAPGLLPRPIDDAHPAIRVGWLLGGGRVLRVSGAGLMIALIVVSHYRAAEAAAIALAAIGAALVLGGVFLGGPRWRLLASGAILLAGAAAAIWRMERAPWAWLDGATMLGSSQPMGLAASMGISGLGVLVLSAGWVGAGLLAAGFVAALVRSLHVARRSAAGDQARSALWACVAAVSACALFVGEGLAVPAVVVTAGLVWGLLPHMMAHRVGRFKGWGVTAAFLAALAMLGLQQRLAGMQWPHAAGPHMDRYGHFAGTFLLAAVLLWQMRAKRWWHGLLCAAGAALLTGLGELAQQHLSAARQAQWRDVVWDLVGAGAALAAFLTVRAAVGIERRLGARSTVSYEKYGPWRTH